MAGGRPVGSQSDKIFRAAFIRLLGEAGRDPDALDRVAKTVLTNAEQGNMMAVQIMRDTIDGKPPQQINAEMTGTLEVLFRTIYEASQDEPELEAVPLKTIPANIGQ